jgi:hypothetical protein
MRESPRINLLIDANLVVDVILTAIEWQLFLGQLRESVSDVWATWPLRCHIQFYLNEFPMVLLIRGNLGTLLSFNVVFRDL